MKFSLKKKWQRAVVIGTPLALFLSWQLLDKLNDEQDINEVAYTEFLNAARLPPVNFKLHKILLL